MRRLITWAVLIAALAAPSPGLAQGATPDTPQVLPPSPPRVASVFMVDDTPASYDLRVTLADFDPGAATGDRTYFGRAFFTVVAGQVVVHQPDGDVAYAAAEKFVLNPGTVADIQDTSDGPARLFMTTLSAPGNPGVEDIADASAPSIPPAIAFSGQATLGTQPARFAINQVIVDFGPGSGSGAHRHNGVGLSIVMAGEMTNRVAEGDLPQAVGDAFLDEPNRATDHRNFGSGIATIAASYVSPLGVPPAVAAELAGSPSLLGAPVPAPNAGSQP